MIDLEYPKDAINLIRNIYSLSYITFIREYFKKTNPIPIRRGTIQGDILSPSLFITFLEPFLQWLERGKYGYSYKTSNTIFNTAACADDLALILADIKNSPSQLEKIDKFYTWVGMGLGINKCAVTSCPNKSKLNLIKFTSFLQNQSICFWNQSIPICNQKKSYKYLGIHLVPSLDWRIQTQITSTKLQEQCKLLQTSSATMKQKMHMTDFVIHAGIAYAFYGVPFSTATIKN